MAQSPVGGTVTQVCAGMQKVLLHQVINLGNAQEIIDGYACKGFLNCIGATDGVHMLII